MVDSIFKQFRSPYGTYVPNYTARNRWAIGDIHGCAKTFEKLLDKIDLRRQDQLFLLGDYINKGPDSLGVLDQIILLQKNGFQIYPIRGNHEQIFLDLCAKKQKVRFTKKDFLLADKVATPALLNEYGNPIRRYLDFMKGLPYFTETVDHFTVHSNFNFKARKPFNETEDMLTNLNYKVDKTWVGKKIILHGHLPYDLEDILKEVAKRKKIINLDNGCVMALQPGKYRPGIGNLLALNLDSYELVIQKNID
jgi:serine/threonine protein phosphatase 1